MADEAGESTRCLHVKTRGRRWCSSNLTRALEMRSIRHGFPLVGKERTVKTEVRQRGSAREKEVNNLKKCTDLPLGVERRDQELTLKTSEVEESVSVQTPM